MIKPFNKVSVSKKSKVISLKGEKNNAKKVPCFVSKNLYLSGNITVNRLYQEKDGIFAYSSQGDVYLESYGQLYQYLFDTMSHEPIITTVQYRYGTMTLMINSTQAKLAGYDFVSLDLPYGYDYLLTNGRIYIIKDDKLYISAVMPLTYFYADSDDFETLTVSKVTEGNIRGIFNIGASIYLVCEKAILKLEVSGEPESFRLEYVWSNQNLNIEENSFARDDEKAYFISDKKLCCIDKNGIKKIDTLLDDCTYSIFDKAGTAENSYLIRIVINGQYKMFVYDSESSQSWIIACSYTGLSKFCGLVFDSSLSVVKQFKYDYLDNCDVTGNKIIDLDDCNLKAITGIEMHVVGSATLVISGLFGNRKIPLKDGCNHVRCKLISNKYSISIESASSDFIGNEVKIKYITYGEMRNGI